MDDMAPLLRKTADLAAGYLDGIDERPVFPPIHADDLRDSLDVPLPKHPTPPDAVIDDLVRAIEPGLVSVAGGRYFGFVTGGHLPASLAADWLTSAWDQNAFTFVSSPGASVVEQVAARWVLEVLDLPENASVGFVTGCQMAHVTCLAAARAEALRRVGWDVSRHGLFGAPRVRLVTGTMRHSTVDRAARLLGFGDAGIELVDVDEAGRMVPEALEERLAEGSGPLIVVAQAGEVNTGEFDPLEAVIAITRRAGGWVHVDGAFGIWAAASPEHSYLTNGLEFADSWAFDAHKWLNVPYDSGVAVTAHPAAHAAAMSYHGEYLVPTANERDAMDWTPDASRRARGIAVYAAIRSLGTQGIAELVDRCCTLARRCADGLRDLPGAEVLNDVVLNQVLLRFADDDTTAAVLSRVQRSGEAWMGPTTWRGRQAIRISVSSWATTEDDVDRTLAAFADAAGSAE